MVKFCIFGQNDTYGMCSNFWHGNCLYNKCPQEWYTWDNENESSRGLTGAEQDFGRCKKTLCRTPRRTKNNKLNKLKHRRLKLCY